MFCHSCLYGLGRLRITSLIEMSSSRLSLSIPENALASHFILVYPKFYKDFLGRYIYDIDAKLQSYPSKKPPRNIPGGHCIYSLYTSLSLPSASSGAMPLLARRPFKTLKSVFVLVSSSLVKSALSF